MKYILKFIVQTLVIIVYTPIFLIVSVWNWKIEKEHFKIYELYHRASRRLLWRLSGKYVPQSV
jgi:hypothetical protein